MITDRELQEAIAECQGTRNPNANTAIKLAAFYTIQDHLFGGDAKRVSASLSNTPSALPQYSYAPDDAPDSNAETILYYSGTDFASAVNGRRTDAVMAVIDELMGLLKGLNKPLYNAVLRKIENL